MWSSTTHLFVVPLKYIIQIPAQIIDDRFNFQELPIEVDPVLFYGDPSFSTGFDYLFAQFRGYDILRDHLENEFEAVFLVGKEVPLEQIKFTGSNADFVEMINLF